MARALKLKTIAEGAETAETIEHLRLHHCDEIQGDYYSQPLTEEEFTQYILAAAQP